VKTRLAFLIVCSSLALVLAACGSEDGGGTPADLPAEQIDAAGAAQTSLASDVGVDDSSIEVVSVSDEVWQDRAALAWADQLSPALQSRRRAFEW
jgi:hypothetical protein